MRPTPEIALAHITVLEMVRHVVDAVHGAARAVQPQFAILMRLATRRSKRGAGHIEPIAMIRWMIRSVTALLI